VALLVASQYRSRETEHTFSHGCHFSLVLSAEVLSANCLLQDNLHDKAKQN
jgi:hypothetical protein